MSPISATRSAAFAPRTSRNPRSSGAFMRPPPTSSRPKNQPFERSPDGLIKHLVNPRMNTRECCVEAYMQFLPPGGRSGRHRHMWEEVIFVVEGAGHDLHWDLRFDCVDQYDWDWEQRAEALRVAARRLHLRPALLHPPALQRRQRRRGAPHRHQQPDREGDGLRLARSVGTRARLLTQHRTRLQT